MAINENDSASTTVTSPTSDTQNIDLVHHNHPLYIHLSNTQGVVLISIQLRGSENYSLWSRSMKIVLHGKNKLGFVLGTCRKELYDPSLHELWDRCNAIVLTWIMNTIAPNLLSTMIYASNAYKVWDDLRERFDKVNAARSFYLHKEIANLTQNLLTVSKYFSKLRELWDEYEALAPPPSCGCPESKQHAEHYQRSDSYDSATSKCQSGLCYAYSTTISTTYPQFSPAPVFTQEQYDQILHMLNKGKQVESVANAATMNNTGTIRAFMSHLVNGNWIIDIGASNHMVHNFKLLSEIKDLTSIGHNKDLLSGNVMGIGKEECGLYILKPDIPEGPVQQLNAKHSNKLAFSANNISSSNKTVSYHHCTVCLIAKQSRLPFSHSTSSSTLPFELVHTDVCGPYRVPTHNGKRSDNGTEFFNEQQNGKVERKHRFILNMARALRFQAFIPLHFWGECVSTSVYLLNRLPTVLLKGASPFEKLYGKVPSLQHLKVFGSLCYATSTSKSDKFSPRAIPDVHLGYSSVQKGYILHGLHSKSFFVSRDIVFQEDIFPFKHDLSGSSPLFPILDMIKPDYLPRQFIPSHIPPPSNSPYFTSGPSVDSPQTSSYPPLSSPSPIAPPHPIRKSSRTFVPPIWLKDYVVPSKGAVCNYSISQYVCYDKLYPTYQTCIAAYSAVFEPTFYVESSTDPKWIEAM
ncbi:uncharacterized protein [Nicotiana sylvestris]|uniref:uncharacterized protein n=1 Tax=Nicotiana sylvestris TaxID=4096 RepID=UPI00388C43F8